jgi:hypothetical protein
METAKSKRALIAALIFTAACLSQIIGFIHYSRRIPHDWLGIDLFIATIIGFAVLAGLFYFRWTMEFKKR